MRRTALGVAVLAALLLAAPTAGAAVSGAAAKRWTAKIAALGQRPAGGKHERRAQRIVWSRLEALGYTVKRQRFTLPSGKRDRNIVGHTPGPTRVTVVAHVDGVRGTSAANDNGSGIGLMLELARLLRETPGVTVAALGAEERAVTGSPYHLGSRRFLRSLSAAERRKVRLALSLDMVGVGTRLLVRGIESRPNRSARIVLTSARALGIKVSYRQDSGVSDHAEMSRAGLPAAWIEWYWDNCWHSACDRIERIKPRKLRRAGRLTLSAARSVLP